MADHCTVPYKTAATLALAAGLSVSANAATLKVGDILPADTRFTDSAGAAHTFADYRGKPLVLEWTNPGCPFVRKFYDAKAMQQLQAETTAKGVSWLTVNSSAPGKEGHLSADSAPAAVAKEGWNGTAYVLDGAHGSTLGKLLGAQTTPHMFVADAQGKLVYAGAIDSIPSFNAADISKADNYVRLAADAVLAGKTPATSSTRPYGCSVKY
ncbi:MAG: redoxin family protein [Pseudomonadaceae bacterium]|nr:redoxin family protein [Pseudomonadaceae bacterium]